MNLKTFNIAQGVAKILIQFSTFTDTSSAVLIACISADK